jgi:hypothetical protein
VLGAVPSPLVQGSSVEAGGSLLEAGSRLAVLTFSHITIAIAVGLTCEKLITETVSHPLGKRLSHVPHVALPLWVLGVTEMKSALSVY